MYVKYELCVAMTIFHGMCRNAIGSARDSAMKISHCGEGQLADRFNYRIQRAIPELCEVMGFQLSSCGADSTISRYCVSSLFCLMERENDSIRPVFQHA
jgi:hypothetical protein